MNAFEEDEESETNDIDEALLDELDDDEVTQDDEMIEGEIPLVPQEDLDADEGEDETAKAFFEDESTPDDEEDDEGDYDSFDDRDEM
jgi:hypothetical protein